MIQHGGNQCPILNGILLFGSSEHVIKIHMRINKIILTLKYEFLFCSLSVVFLISSFKESKARGPTSSSTTIFWLPFEKVTLFMVMLLAFKKNRYLNWYTLKDLFSLIQIVTVKERFKFLLYIISFGNGRCLF